MHFSQSLSLSQPLATKIFSTAIDRGRLVNAYLFAGTFIEDKWLLAKELAAHLNCAPVKSGSTVACFNRSSPAAEEIGQKNWCTDCRWLACDQHPQAFLKLSGEQNKSGKIMVDQTRLILGELSKTSPYIRVVVVENASQEVLHRPAANSLLKTIEEPRSNVLLLFFAQAVPEVLTTVVSRCQVINMSNNKDKQKKCFSISNINTNEIELISNRLMANDNEHGENFLLAYEKLGSKDASLLDAINLADNIQALLREEDDLEILLDFFVQKELLALKNFFSTKAEISYAKELLLLAEITKEQSKHYVGQRAVVETFVFAWYKLKQTGANPLRIRL